MSSALAACPPAAKRAKTGGAGPPSVDARRWRKRAGGGSANSSGPVVYWMSRDQRVADNWSLVHAAEEADRRGAPLGVAYAHIDPTLGAQTRQQVFELKGMKEVAAKLAADGVPFFLCRCDTDSGADGGGESGGASGEGGSSAASPTVASVLGPMLRSAKASLLVMDTSPLRGVRASQDDVIKAVGSDVEVHQVDSYNVVPIWEASDKEEFAARTIRPKISRKLHEWMLEIPGYGDGGRLERLPAWPSSGPQPGKADWDGLLAQARGVNGGRVKEVAWAKAGEAAGRKALQDFLTPERLKLYATKRNDPTTPEALSNLSPWLRFGQLAPQRAALEAAKHRGKWKEAVDSYTEELVIRRELAENFCWFQPKYDSVSGAKDWALKSIEEHKDDKREHLYSRKELEKMTTHDELWNACQLELELKGKLHGYMRMYWAKKILEWTKSSDDALADAIYFNDKYSLDGRCPSGFVGCMWSIVGIHDRAWGPVRQVFGKVRYMNYAGCKRKFKIKDYVAACDALKTPSIKAFAVKVEK